MLALADHVAPPGKASPPAPSLDLALSDAERAAGRAALARLAPPRERPPVVVHLSRSGDPRSWPLEHAAALAWSLAARGHPVVVVSGPGEIAEGRAVEALCAGVAGIAHAVGQRGPRELAALLAATAERGGRFVGTVSGPAHVAAASGIDCVLLAGPQDERRTGPWPVRAAPAAPRRGHAVVRTERALACAPCRARECAHREGPVCMGSLTPEQVLAVVSAPPED
jgi:ADP-heptose:LPS heptosyltransferase